MERTEETIQKRPAAECGCLEIKRDGAQNQIITSILQEHHMNVFVNGQFWTVFSCTPEYLTEAVFGRLKTEGIIEKKKMWHPL